MGGGLEGSCPEAAADELPPLRVAMEPPVGAPLAQQGSFEAAFGGPGQLTVLRYLQGSFQEAAEGSATETPVLSSAYECAGRSDVFRDTAPHGDAEGHVSAGSTGGNNRKRETGSVAGVGAASRQLPQGGPAPPESDPAALLFPHVLSLAPPSPDTGARGTSLRAAVRTSPAAPASATATAVTTPTRAARAQWGWDHTSGKAPRAADGAAAQAPHTAPKHPCAAFTARLPSFQA